MDEIQEYIDGIPNISGSEEAVAQAMDNGKKSNVFLTESRVQFNSINSACAIALHMHQPLIPAGGSDMRIAGVISNLQYMFEHQDIGDNHNAGTFLWCYKRMGDFIPQLAREGKEPRVMLEYSGTLFHGLRAMSANDVIDNLKKITCDPGLRRTVEWLGCPWGHAVAPSTPAQDYGLHVRAWQHQFAAIFGMEALGRVRGFSPSEMALPNHPDVAYAFVKTLKECGFDWVLVQEHTVERKSDGQGLGKKHIPHRLICQNSKGETVSIVAIIKTQGSDTKLVAQMQPYYEAKSLSQWELADKKIPPLVTQIADGENGGVMMNEFPGKYMDAVREASGSFVPLMNVTEYLEQLEGMGITEKDFPEIIPLFQKRIWDRFKPGSGPEELSKVIDTLKKEDGRFTVEGGSWTNNISWVKGYENVLAPMEKASSLFFEKVLKPGIPTKNPAFRKSLFFLLTSQTSCYRYWGQGLWTEYGKEICRRCIDVINYDIK
jgi:hypothetical protein